MLSSALAQWLNWLYAVVGDNSAPVAEWAFRLFVIMAFVGLVAGIALVAKGEELSAIPAFVATGAAVGFFGTFIVPSVVGWPIVALLWAVGL